MKTIPIYDIKPDQHTLEFEVEPWKKSISKYDTTQPHRHNYYEILVFLKGGGQHEIDFRHYRIKSKSLHFISANRVHEVKRTPSSDGFSLLFSDSFVPAISALHELDFYRPDADPVLNLTTEEFKELQYVLHDIRQEFKSVKKDRAMLQSLLSLLLMKTQRLYGQKVKGETANHTDLPAIILEFEKLVARHVYDHWRAGDYAKALHTGTGNLNSLCKQHYSRSTESVINDRLLTEIKRCLAYTDKSIKEICFDLNFDDPAYFTRFFRKKTGATPGEYRKNLDK